MKKRFFLLISCLVLICGTLFAAKKEKPAPMPDWVTEPASVYPSSQYFAQVGYDQNRATAEINACSAIASIFSQNIKSKTKASSRMVQAEQNGQVSTVGVSTLSQDVTRAVDAANLIGVEIKGAWFSPKENVWYCVAVLDKPKTTEIYRQMINQNNEHIATLLDYDTDDEYSFETFARVDFAQEIALVNEGHLERLRIINNGVASELKPTCMSSKDLKLRSLEIAKQIPIAVIVSGDIDGRIRAAFSKVFTDAGFRASDNPNERYVFKADCVFTEAATSDGKTARCQYTITGGLNDTGFDEELLPCSISGRKSDLDYPKAQIKALAGIEKSDIGTKYSKKFADYLRNITVE